MSASRTGSRDMGGDEREQVAGSNWELKWLLIQDFLVTMLSRGPANAT
jgi:hypothetical protein